MLIIAQVLREKWSENDGFCSFTNNQQPCEWSCQRFRPGGLAGKIVKYCPLSEPIRLQDLEDSARSQAWKKISFLMYPHAFIRMFVVCNSYVSEYDPYVAVCYSYITGMYTCAVLVKISLKRPISKICYFAPCFRPIKGTCSVLEMRFPSPVRSHSTRKFVKYKKESFSRRKVNNSPQNGME